MNNPFGAQDRATGDLDARRGLKRALAERRSAMAEQPAPVPSPHVYRQGDTLPGSGPRPEQTLKESELDRDALLNKRLNTPDEFRQLRLLATELAQKHNNEKLEQLAHKTSATRLDMQILQQEVRNFLATLKA